jgi:uncharacterized membrane protein (DUF441 family)
MSIWLVFKEFLTNKKFIVAAAGVIIAFSAKHGLNLDPETTQYIVGIVIAYLIGQGIADNGKEAAKVNAVAEVSRSLDATSAIEAVKNT